MRDLARGLLAAVCALGVFTACGGGGGGAAPAALALQTITVSTQPAGPESPFGSSLGGDTAELDGTGFAAGLTVRFGATLATVVNVTATRVTVTTPAGAEGFADVVVRNPDGSESTLTGVFQFFVPPSVVNALAQTGPTAGTASAPIAGGETVEITGGNFDASTRVAVAGIELAVAFVDETTLRVTVPAVALEQTADLVVTDDVGLAATLASGFFYTQEFSLDPMPDGLSDDHMRHLLRRAGFGADAAAIAAAQASGLAATVDGLVTIANDDVTEAEAFAFYGATAPPVALVNGRVVQEFWCHLLARNANPLQERLAYFLHDHFATSQDGIPGRARWFMHPQVQLFRRFMLPAGETLNDGKPGLGYDWEKLLVEIGKDRAMLVWLDGVVSVVGNPNENYARELWELFMLGEGNGYTETDIQEAARAFTGFVAFDTNGRGGDGPIDIAYIPGRHDGGEKTILGATGNYGYDSVSPFFVTDIAGGQLENATFDPNQETDPADTDGGIVALTLQQRPTEASQFICGKLAAFFLYENPPADLVDDLAQTLRDNDWNLKPVLERILKSKALFSARAVKAQVKSPVEYLVGFLRDTGIELGGTSELNASRMRTNLQAMGQSVLQPPDVNGWPTGLAWVSSQGVLERLNFVNAAVAELDDVTADVDPLIPPPGQRAPDQLVDHIAALLDVELDATTRASHVAYVTSQLSGDQIVPFSFDPNNDEHLRMKTRGLIWLIAQYYDAQRN